MVAQHDSEIAARAASYVPRVLLDVLHENPGRPIPWIDPVEGTLVFADVSGFTAMSEALAEEGKEGAEHLTDIISGFFGEMLDIARSFGANTMNFGGDAVLLLFHGTDHAARATAAALGMLEATEKHSAFAVGRQRIKLGMSVGGHTGTFYLAAVGAPERRMQYVALGPDTVRTAEAEGAAEAGQFVVTAQIAEALGETLDTETRGGFHRVLRLNRSPFGSPSMQTGELDEATLARLLAYVPPPVARALKSGEAARDTEGDHRKVSIVFVNVLGTDSLLESGGPDALRDDLQRYTETLVELCHQYGGFLVSNDIYTDGIKYIVVFGAPVAHEDDTASALRFCHDLRERISAADLRLEHRLGANCGFVFAGDVGPTCRRQYTVMGDAVNLAARLMSAAEPGTVLLSKAMAEEAGSACVVADLAPIRVKGKSQPIPICTLEEPRVEDVGASVQRGASLLGRDAELEVFEHAIAGAESGVGRCFTITGVAGVGKSRLLLAYEELLGKNDWHVIAAPCFRHTRSKPYAPLIGLMKSLLGIEHGDDPAARSRKVEEFIEVKLPASRDMASLLNSLVGSALPESQVVRSLDDTARRQRLIGLIRALFRSAAQAHPLAVVIEDVHWADASSIDLIGQVGADSAVAPFFVIVTMRPGERTVPRPPVELTTEIVLDELGREAASWLLSEGLGGVQVPAEILDAVLERTRGNPLFLEETARALKRSGLLDGVGTASPMILRQALESLDLPDRVQGLIMSRLDRLEGAQKDVLRSAAVIGSVFDEATLEGVLDAPTDHPVPEVLNELASEEFLELEDGRVRFRHALIQDVAYDSLLFARRRELHRRTAEYLEAANAARLEPYFEELVHHFDRCEDADRMRFYAVRAADRARAVYAHDEAIEYYRLTRSRTQARTPTAALARSLVSESMGDVWEAAGRYSDAIECFRRALRSNPSAAPRAHGDPIVDYLGDAARLPSRAAVLGQKIGEAYERGHSHYDLAIRWLETAEDSLPPRHPKERARILMTKASALFRQGDHEASLALGREALRLARRTDDEAHLAYSLNMVACFQGGVGEFAKAIELHQQAVDEYDRLGDLAGQLMAQGNLAATYHHLGNLDDAVHHYEIALSAAEQVQDAARLAMIHMNLGEALVARGQMEDADRHLRAALEWCERSGGLEMPTGLTHLYLARANMYMGRLDEAFDSLADAVLHLEQAGASDFLVEATIQEGELWLGRGDLDRAATVCVEAVDEAQVLGISHLEARGRRILSRVLFAQGSLEAASTEIRTSIEIAERIGAEHERGLSLLAYAALNGLGAWPDGPRPYKASIRSAEAALRRVGAQFDLARAVSVREQLARVG